METIKEVLNRHVDVHSDPTKEQFQSTMDGLHRLMTELERPENRELMRFVLAWQKLEKELDRLQCQIQERMANAPTDRVNELLKKLVKKN
jgi:hypothetical protein